MQTPLTFKDATTAASLLEACGYKATHYKAFDVAFTNDQQLIVITPQQIILLEEFDNDEFFGREWREVARIKTYRTLTLDQFIGHLVAFGAITYEQIINKAADMGTLSDRRALWHLKEALRKSTAAAGKEAGL